MSTIDSEAVFALQLNNSPTKWRDLLEGEHEWIQSPSSTHPHGKSVGCAELKRDTLVLRKTSTDGNHRYYEQFNASWFTLERAKDLLGVVLTTNHSRNSIIVTDVEGVPRFSPLQLQIGTRILIDSAAPTRFLGRRLYDFDQQETFRCLQGPYHMLASTEKLDSEIKLERDPKNPHILLAKLSSEWTDVNVQLDSADKSADGAKLRALTQLIAYVNTMTDREESLGNLSDHPSWNDWISPAYKYLEYPDIPE